MADRRFKQLDYRQSVWATNPPNAAVHVVNRIDVILRIITNWSAIVADLSAIDRRKNAKISWQLKNGVTFLSFQLDGIERFSDILSWIKDPQKILPPKFDQLEGLIKTTRAALQSSIPVSNEIPEPIVDVPNVQLLELLALRIIDDIPEGDLTPGGFQAQMRLTKIFQTNSHPDSKSDGLPRVIFVCFTHKIVACSLDVLDALKAVEASFRRYRQERFTASQAMLSTYERVCKQSRSRFRFMKDEWTSHEGLNWKVAADNLELSNTDFNEFYGSLYSGHRKAIEGPNQDSVALLPNHGFDHESERGHSFYGSAWGSGKFMEEMSRC